MRMIFILVFVTLATKANALVAERGEIVHQGQTRVHYFHGPKDAGPDTPLVIALHGMGGNARNLRFGLGLTEQLDAAGFAVVYPQGLRLPQGSRHWNAGFDFMQVDDLGYLTSLAKSLIDAHGLSQTQTMIFGISMGGYMAYHMACHAQLDIVGIVSVAGSMHPSDYGRCPAETRTSLMHIHGALDPLIPFDGGTHWSMQNGRPISVTDVVASWAMAAKAADARKDVVHPKVQETRYLNMDTGTEVQLLVLPSFGHDWPSKETAGYDAMGDIVRFLVRHKD